jgi:hypothetical protein
MNAATLIVHHAGQLYDILFYFSIAMGELIYQVNLRLLESHSSKPTAILREDPKN